MKWQIGCSGFHYKHWRGEFYPQKLAVKNWFDYYCTYFNTLELNVTHYRFPEVSFLNNWYQKSSPDFSFAVKVYKGITHYKKLHDCKKMVDDFYAIVAEGLKEKAACILFQFPPSFHYNEKNLDRILLNLNPGFLNVAEFRHASWWNEEVFKAFAENNIIFCGMSHPSLPVTIVKNNPVLYYRMHGAVQLYASLYSEEELEEIVNEIQTGKKIDQAFIYFNNDMGAAAVTNARQMKELIGKSK